MMHIHTKTGTVFMVHPHTLRCDGARDENRSYEQFIGAMTTGIVEGETETPVFSLRELPNRLEDRTRQYRLKFSLIDGKDLFSDFVERVTGAFMLSSSIPPSHVTKPAVPAVKLPSPRPSEPDLGDAADDVRASEPSHLPPPDGESSE